MQDLAMPAALTSGEIVRLLPAVTAAEDALARLDERVLRSPVADGFKGRGHFFDAVGALWVAGEFVHVEDLVLHDAQMDSRVPSHELTVAAAVLRSRRRMVLAELAWPFSKAGLAALAGLEMPGVQPSPNRLPVENEPDTADRRDPLQATLAEVDALLARSQARLEQHRFGQIAEAEGERQPAPRPQADPMGLFSDEEWDEEARLDLWLRHSAEMAGLPASLGAVLSFDAWERLEPLRRRQWLGGQMVSAQLRLAGKLSTHLLAFHVGLRDVRFERRRSRDRMVRLEAFLEALEKAATAGMKDLDRLTTARQQMALRLRNRRSNSRLAALADFVLSRPIVSSAMVARELRMSDRGALKLIDEMGIREITGRSRYRAWGIL